MDRKIITKAEKEISKVDAILGKVIKSQKIQPLKPRKEYFVTLCRAINAQQISVAAASTIYGRLKDVTEIKPEKIVKLTEAQKKKIGLSRQKSSYLIDLAGHFLNNPDVYNHLEKQSDEEVIEELTEIRGIGIWTSQMFLISSLARPDVFAADDVGLQRAIINIYGYKTLPAKSTLDRISKKWKPYRTVASLHLWHSLNNPSIYKGLGTIE